MRPRALDPIDGAASGRACLELHKNRGSSCERGRQGVGYPSNTPHTCCDPQSQRGAGQWYPLGRIQREQDVEDNIREPERHEDSCGGVCIDNLPIGAGAYHHISYGCQPRSRSMRGSARRQFAAPQECSRQLKGIAKAQREFGRYILCSTHMPP